MNQPQQPNDWSTPTWQPAPPAPPIQPTSGDLYGYATPAYPGGGYAGYGQPPMTRATNGLAIASLVCALAGLSCGVSAPVGAILGHVARRRIRESGEAGAGMALAGIIVGWIVTGLILAYIAFIVIFFIGIGAAGGTSGSP